MMTGVIPSSRVDGPPELRARTLGEMMDAAIKIVGKNFKVLMPMAALLVAPFQIVGALATVSVRDEVQRVADGGTPKFSNATVGALVATGVLGLLGTVVVTGALTWFIAEYCVGRTPGAGQAVRFGLRRTPVTIGTYLLLVLVAFVVSIPAIALVALGAFIDSVPIIVIAFVVFFVMFMWVFIRLSCAVPAIIVERLGPVRALKRSFGLVKGFYWKVLGTLIITGLLLGIVAQVITAIINGILGALGGGNKGFEFVWLAVGGTVAQAVTAPVSAAIAVLLYMDLRIRKEGFDLEVLARSLDAHATGRS
jgi:hypothetical protein